MHIVNTLQSGQFIRLLTRSRFAHMHFDRNSRCLFIQWWHTFHRKRENYSKTSSYVETCTLHTAHTMYICIYFELRSHQHFQSMLVVPKTTVVHCTTATSATDLWTIGGQQQNSMLPATAIPDVQISNKMILEPTMLFEHCVYIFVLRHVYSRNYKALVPIQCSCYFSRLQVLFFFFFFFVLAKAENGRKRQEKSDYSILVVDFPVLINHVSLMRAYNFAIGYEFSMDIFCVFSHINSCANFLV